MNICFLVWSPDVSGGTNVIFEHAIRLLNNHSVTIVTQDEVCFSRLNWFPGADKFTWKIFDEVSDDCFDLTIATWWRTVYFLNKVKSNKYAYFVQSIESKFYPESDVILRNLVELTYSLDLFIITEATWIKEYLKDNYDKNAFLVKNGIRKEYFNTNIVPLKKKEQGKTRLIVEGPLGVSFKNTELAIELANQTLVDEIWLLTSTEIAAYPKIDKLFSRVPISEVGAIYSSCDFLLKLSTEEGMFGPPLECFHCGVTSITYNVTGFDEYIIDGTNGLVSFNHDNQDIINKINDLVKDSDKLSKLKDNALSTAQSWPDWNVSSSIFEEKCNLILNDDHIQNINVISNISNLSWDMYEHSLSLTSQRSEKSIISSQNIKFKVLNSINIKYPRLFSLLRRLKWTVLANISRYKSKNVN